MNGFVRRVVVGGLLVGAAALAGCGEDQVIYQDAAVSGGNGGDGNGTPTAETLPEGNASSLEIIGPEPVLAEQPDFVDQGNFFAQACNPAGTGRDLGSLTGSLPLTNCDGETVDLHDFCGRRKAILLVSAAGWCGACRSSMPEMAALQEEGRREGLDVFVVWGEDDSSVPADQNFCNQVASQYGLDTSRTFFDPGFSTTQNRLNPVAEGESSYGLPWHVVLDPFDMTYFWSSSDDRGVSEQEALQTLLQ